MLIVKSVKKNSVGQDIGIEKGDKILSFNGHNVVDILDYIYFDEQTDFTVQIERDNKVYDCEIEKEEDEKLGLTFTDDGLALKTCHNNCIFCFVNQLPKGMRKSLYIKDDDYRQSFLCGNYITLTNISDDEIDRIIRLKLSPLYISIHAIGNLRSQVLGNRFADNILERLQKLSDGGIDIHAQIVLVRNVNDGQNLIDTIRAVGKIKGVKTLAVVPCGITEHRQNLTKILDIDGEYSKGIIDLVNKENERLKRVLVFPADDFYVRAKVPFESYNHYGDFWQIENGVGMFSKFIYDYDCVKEKRVYNKRFLTITGVASKEFIEGYAKKTEKLVKGLKIDVLAVENEFFGKTITATGLLTGRDIVRAIKNYKGEFDEVVIPKNMMKEMKNVFLDGMTIESFENKINKPVRLAEVGGQGFFKVFTEDIQ